MVIHVANTHPIRDPFWGQAQIDQHFCQQVKLLEELVDYGVQLLMRALESCEDEPAQHMILTVLFRQALVASDAAHILITAGAIDAVHLQLRALMEARWGLILALREPGKWGRHLHVASLHEQRSWTLQSIPGTAEYAANQEARNLVAKYDGAVQPAEEAVAYRDALNSILERDVYKQMSEGFDSYAVRKHRPPPWYFDPSVGREQQLTSIWKLASEVGAAGEYKSIYRHASYFTHGGYSGTHLKSDHEGPSLRRFVRQRARGRHSYLHSQCFQTAFEE